MPANQTMASPVKYNGQEKPGDGTITGPAVYVESRFGSGFLLQTAKSLSGFSYHRQFDLSVYYHVVNKVPWSEGNCSLVAEFELLNYLQYAGKYPKLPPLSSKTSLDASRDSFYAKYKSDLAYSITTPKSLPMLYVAVRTYAVLHNGYQVSGTNPLDEPTQLRGVAAIWGYTGMATSHYLTWSWTSQVVNEINAGYPTIWNVANSETYGAHTMVVTGYQTYKKVVASVLGVQVLQYVYIMQVADGWYTSTRYFYFNSSTAIGTFVKVR